MKRYYNPTIRTAYDEEHDCMVITQCPPKYLEAVLDDGFSPVYPDTFEPVHCITSLHDLYNDFICGEIVLAK